MIRHSIIARRRIATPWAVVLVLLGAFAPVAFAQTATPIAVIQANPAAFALQTTTIEGVVTLPINFRSPFEYSGYIQDSSGRGLNVHTGSTVPPNATLLGTVGNIVRLTGEIQVAPTDLTVRMTNITDVSLIGSGGSVAPIHLSTLAANDARWEGTLIDVEATVSSSASSGLFRNYTLNDGSGAIVARVATNLGIATIPNSTLVRARGAGTMQGSLSQFQFFVGQAADFVATTATTDNQPPALVGAASTSQSSVIVTFSEAVQAASGGSAANYQVFETANPATMVAVTAVNLSGPVATLTLASPLRIQFDYTVRVANVQDTAGNTMPAPLTQAFPSGGVIDSTAPTLSSATASALTTVVATFSEAIDPTTGATAGNYVVAETANMGNTVAAQSVVVSTATATVTLASPLAAGTGYTLRVTGVEDLAGNPIAGTATATFTTAGGGGSCTGAITIASIQANPMTFDGQIVTIQGQVYIPSNYRGATASGYIQDASGRGINVFGTTANDPRLQNTGNVVCLTGTVDLFFTTVEIANLTAISVVSSGNPPLVPQHLSTGAAASTQFEGTFIEVTGTISASAASGPGRNYTVDDGSGPVDVRVVDTLGIPQFANGTRITARGAGGQFQTTFQINVGRVADVFEDSGTDTTPPTLNSATAPSLTSARASFSESIDAVTGGNVANYSVFPTATPSSPVTISSVAVSGSTATLTLATSLTAETPYTLRAQSIEDLAGNAMPAPQTAAFTPASPGACTGAIPIATIQANPGAFDGQVVTIQGQVYIPTNYRGATLSGYIQDSSGRGINVFGNTTGDPRLQDTGNIVCLTGTIDLFFTTVEITNLTSIAVISSGNPPLQPIHLTTAQASSTTREGTFIEVTATITTSAVSGPGRNYTVNDGSGPVDVRVVDPLNVAQIPNGTRITARGAGGQFNTTFQINVGRAGDIFVDTGGPDTTPPSAVSATAPTATRIDVTLSEAVTTGTGTNAANYSVFETATPSATVAVTAAALSSDRRTASLTLGSSLADGRGYSVRVSGLTDDAANTMTAPQTVTFTRGGGAGVTPIATIQANPSAFSGMTVTVEGQVYIPSNYRGTTISGYIQDSSGRGINLFGNGGDVAALRNTGNIVRVTGAVELFFTTVEISGITAVTLVSSGNPPLQPTPLTTGDAASPEWEGTYILASGEILAKTVQATAINYTIDDGSGPVVARVVLTLSAPEFNVGQTITARGAGGQFQSDFQILVGEQAAIFEGMPTDTFPPNLQRADATGAQQITLTFNEALQAASAQTTSNYDVFRTNSPGTTIAVSSAQLAGTSQVVLSLASELDVGLGFTVRVRNVADALGNAISAAGVTRVVEQPLAESVAVSGPRFTFLPRVGESYPITLNVPSTVASGGSEVLLRIFDVQGRLKRTLFDSRFDQNAFTNNRTIRSWDGRDDVGQVVPAGTYVVHLLVTGQRNGDRQDATMPVVVATRLDR